MVVYFVATRVTGIIGIFTSMLSALYTEPVVDYIMFRIYNAMAPNQVSIEDIDSESGENITAVALDMAEFLYNVTERIYSFTSMSLVQVQVFDLKEGISFEQWSLVFIGALVGIVVLVYGLDWWLVDEVYKADVFTLIETTTMGGVGERPASTTTTMTKKEKKAEQKR